MLFNSSEFIFYFLPATVVLYYAAPLRWRIHALICVSLFFYSWWNPLFAPILFASIVVNFLVGAAIARALLGGAKRRARRFAIAGIICNLTLLGFFKYRYFLGGLAGLSVPESTSLILPLAISFFTFQQIMFLVDTWHGDIGPVPFTRYAALVSFFPHLIAGPIVRPNELMPQFASAITTPRAGNVILTELVAGASIFAIGLFKKVVLADGISGYATPVFNLAKAGQAPTTFDAWTGLLAYHFQIYFDFSAYSTMAIGLALMLGFRLPLNFRSPYKAAGIIEFWRRWHISLSRFLRDYLYVPLGGSRHGDARRWANLTITMLLGGLWHGAAWGFVLWGGLHGLYLIINHAWRRFAADAMPTLPTALSIALTFTAVAVAWVPFKTETLAPALTYYRSMTGMASMACPTGACVSVNAPIEVLPFLALLAAIVWLLPTAEQVFLLDSETDQPAMLHWRPSITWALVVGLLLVTSVAGIVTVGKGSEFLYFQF